MKLLLTCCFALLILPALAQKKIVDPNVQLRDLNTSFHGISVSGGIDLYISSGDEAVAVSAASTEVRDRIKTEVDGGILKIYLDGNGIRNLFRGDHKLKAYVSYKTLRYLSASGGCDVFTEGVIKSDVLKLSLSGGCDFLGKLDVDKLDVHQSGGTDIKVSGRAVEVTIRASGGSDFVGNDFTAEVATISASGASDVSIAATRVLSASASGASDVRYKGDPEVRNMSASGGSSVKKRS